MDDPRGPGTFKNFIRYVGSLLNFQGWQNPGEIKILCNWIIDLIEGALYDWSTAQPIAAVAHDASRDSNLRNH